MTRSTSLFAATLLSLVLAGESLATSWTLPTTLSSDATLSGLVVLDGGVAVALYSHGCLPGSCNSIRMRRTTDGGATWEPMKVLAADGNGSAIGGRGSNVDVTWFDDGHVWYRRSSDGGATFGAARELARMAGGPTAVARGPNGVVVVAWANNPYNEPAAIKARVSNDGGRSFGSTVNVASHATGLASAGRPVAVGDGVIYVAYIRQGALKVKRSLGLGSTWKPAASITESLGEGYSVAADGDDGHIVYTHANGSIHHRRTQDRGKTWSVDNRLWPRDWNGWGPNVSAEAGVVRVVFHASNGLFYRESVDGVTWTPPERISEVGLNASVGFADRVVVAYDVWFPDRGQVRVRARTP